MRCGAGSRMVGGSPHTTSASCDRHTTRGS